jgi:ribosomal protein S18 acetylase RimI-like enzyme
MRHKGSLWGMYVAPEGRGKGLGRKLVQEAILRASSLNELKQLILAVAIKNTAARALYLSLGFKSYGMEPASLKVSDEYLDDDMMILRFENK